MSTATQDPETLDGQGTRAARRGVLGQDWHDLLPAVRAGDGAAWSALVERQQGLVRSVARSCGVREHDLPDVAQEVWLRLFRHLDKLRDPAAFTGWLVALTRNVSADALARSSRTTATGTLDDLAGAAPRVDADADLDAGLDRAERVLAVRRGLARLDRRHRELLLLVTAEPPVPYRVIADRLGMPVGSIGPTRARLLRRLADTDDVSSLLDGAAPEALRSA